MRKGCFLLVHVDRVGTLDITKHFFHVFGVGPIVEVIQNHELNNHK